MATSPFLQDPVVRVQEQSLGRVRSATPTMPGQPAPAPETPATPRQYFDTQATRTGVPANVLWAIAEQEDAAGRFDQGKFEALADQIGQEILSGSDVRKSVLKFGGETVLNRAFDIADVEYPSDEQVAADASRNNNTRTEDLVRSGVGGVLTGVGTSVQAFGRVIGSDPVDLTPEHTSVLDRIANVLNAPTKGVGWLFGKAGEALAGAGGGLVSSTSDRSQAEMQGSTFKGNLLEPSTWSMGDDPSPSGVALLAANVLGNLAPIVVASLASGGTAAAIVGGAQGGEIQAQSVGEMLAAAGQDGTLQATSEYYKTLVSSGVPPDDALARTIAAGEGMAFVLAAPIGAVGGAATSAILGRGATQALSGGLTRRLTAGAGLGALEEGTQEAAEGAAGRLGGQLATGVDLDPMANTFGDFMMGALAGAPIGAVGGIDRQPPAPPAPPTPTGTDLVPAPLQLTGPAGSVPTPPEAYDPVTGEVLAPAAPGPAPAAPLGPLASIGAMAPASAAAPAVRFPDMKPGAEVTLRDPDGRDIPVVFLREEGENVVVRDAGQELVIPAPEFDVARVAAQTKPEVTAPAPVAQTSPVAQTVQNYPIQATPVQPEQVTPEIAPPASAPQGTSVPDAPTPVSSPAGIEVLTNAQIPAIQTNARVFQYKAGSDVDGVSERLRDVTQWDSNRTGIALVYEYADGRREIVDGHQRLGLAKRMVAAGQQVDLPVRVLREVDGVTPAMARQAGAEKNIAEGTGSSIDAAKIFRETRQTASQLNLPRNSQLVRDGDSLSKLSEQAFGMVINEVASQKNGAIVGNVVKDQSRHADILSLLGRLDPANATQAEAIVRQAIDSQVTETQTDMFGTIEVASNLYVERAKVMDQALKDLGAEITTFKTLGTRGEMITGAGNVLQANANAARQDAATAARASLMKQANTKGVISDALTQAARAVKDGGTVAAAAKQFVAALQTADAGSPKTGAGTGRTGDSDGRPEKVGTQGDVKPTYINRPVLNGDEIRQWAISQGFASTVPAVDMHVTLAYSKTPVDRSAEAFRPVTKGIAVRGGARSVEQFGDAAVVLTIRNDALAERNAELLAAGASSDFPDYRPHITISYSAEGVDLAKVVPFKGAIRLGPETVADIKENAAADAAKAEVPAPFDKFNSNTFTRKDEVAMLFGLPEGAKMEFGDDQALGAGGIRIVDADGKPIGPFRSNLKAAADAARDQAKDAAKLTPRPPARPAKDLFDQPGAKGGVGERQTDIEDLIAEAVAADATAPQTEAEKISARREEFISDLAKEMARAKTFRAKSKLNTGAGRHINSEKIAEKYGLDTSDTADRSGVFSRILTEAEFAGLGRVEDYVSLARAIVNKYVPGKSAEAEQNGTKESRMPDDEGNRFAAELMQQLALVDDIFQNPKATSKTLKGVFAEIDPSVTYVGETKRVDDQGNPEAVEQHLLRSANDQDIFVFRTDDEVWMDVSRLIEGSAGSAVYSAVADYAFNTGRVFIGDPAGLSPIAARRRTEAMLSSALKHGTTKHLAPHEVQTEGVKRLGIKPLGWREGEDFDNVASMIGVSIANLTHHVPELARARFDFASRTFRTAKGEPISDEMFDAWSDAHPRIRAAGAGRRTLKRGILLNTLAHAESGQRPGLLARALREPYQLVKDGLRDTFYSRLPSSVAPVVARLRSNDVVTGANIAARRSSALDWIRTNLVRQEVINTETGFKIGFNTRGAKESVYAAGDDILNMLPALKAILEQGRYLGAEVGKADRPGVVRVHKFSATVELDGLPKDVVVTVREVTPGLFQYRLSRDTSVGARFALEPTAGASKEAGLVRSGLEVSPDNLDIATTTRKSNPIQPSDFRPLAEAVQAEIARSIPGGKITGRLVRGLADAAGIPIQGRQRGANIEVNPASPDGVVGVARHEIIHALRDQGLWGKPYGMFTQAEWQGLVRAARADAALMADIATRYKGKRLTPAQMIEEGVAEQYRLWAKGNDGAGPLAKTFGKIKAFLTALANAMRGRGFQSAARTFQSIADGDVGGRGPDGPGASGPGPERELRMPDNLPPRDEGGRFRESTNWVRDLPTNAKGWAKDNKDFFSNLLTDSMGGGRAANLLALVPGRPLFMELGKNLNSAKVYLRVKEEMDALRNEWHSKTDVIAQDWRKLLRSGKAVNADLMELMHASTLAGIDPSQPYDGDKRDQVRKESYAKLRTDFMALPEGHRKMFSTVANAYDEMGDAFEDAVLENIRKAAEVGMKRAERAHRAEMRRIKDEGLQGKVKDDAVAEADSRLALAKGRSGWALRSRINGLRKQFESNRLKGPYFPLARFGNYFVTLRDGEGKVVSFSRYESVREQTKFANEMKATGVDVQIGVMDQSGGLKDQVDPSFVADVQGLLADFGADTGLMDAVWQRWLETLPDQSIRTSRIHRKGREGYDKDALRAFTNHLFHGSHQLARLKYGLDLEEALADADLEARNTADPNRAQMVVNEMRKRLEFTMNPTGGPVAARLSSLAYIWYLGMSPAAALVNLSQTTVLAPALLGARFPKVGMTGAIKAIGAAAKDYGMAKGDIKSTKRVNNDERTALLEAERRGTIDKTQAHDLASVAETGVEYNGKAEAVMKVVSWAFHTAEVANRSVTFLAGYRMARADGMNHEDAIEVGADLTWKTHFDYQGSSRPRIMQNDAMKIITTFRQFTVNMLFRMFRDVHQSVKGENAAARKEARTQLTGITLSMFAHAGIKGVWGYGILTTLLGMFFEGGDDDVNRYLQDALLIEGDGAGPAAWNYIMGAAMNGIPGQITGIDLTNRMGMPNLWFRDGESGLDGEETVQQFLIDMLGPIAGIGLGFGRGATYMADGDVFRGIETAVPKVVRDVMKAGRYAVDGVLTRRGDTIVDDPGVSGVIKTALGFTPADVAERYDFNSRMMNRNELISGDRSDIQRTVGDYIIDGATIPESAWDQVRAFNREYPEDPITSDTIRQSVQGRQRASARNEFGIQLNPKLNDRIRGEEAPLVYN